MTITARAGGSGPGSRAVAGQRGRDAAEVKSMAAPAPLSADSLLALTGLLSSGSGNGDSADPAQGPAGDRSGPGSIGPPKAGGASAAPQPPEEGKAIWSAEEVTEGNTGDASWDPREQPEYEIVFKQQVRAEDLFLGMSRKDPSTACCEDMLIKIKLPDTKASDITLDIQEKLLDFRSPQKRLLLHLPHPVDTTNGKARFLSEQATLEVTLRMKRELDFINFA
ncbi:dynein assembly factor 6, axonemal isoform X2 [Crotalus tigris]|uniref:dynein assembly factor 6, axonemal isoform X2 n=1 Tax=Crotalus tigris TaxID=88082 RepID=UPI00192F70D6|nr:dynein assembly factor 6, axonemal isoform X2 [Crotalus tigris]